MLGIACANRLVMLYYGGSSRKEEGYPPGIGTTNGSSKTTFTFFSLKEEGYPPGIGALVDRRVRLSWRRKEEGYPPGIGTLPVFVSSNVTFGASKRRGIPARDWNSCGEPAPLIQRHVEKKRDTRQGLEQQSGARPP